MLIDTFACQLAAHNFFPIDQQLLTSVDVKSVARFATGIKQT